MKIYPMADPIRYSRMTTAELRETFLVDELFGPGAIAAVYVDLDRTVIGSAVPTDRPLDLGTYDALKSSYFTERRELGILNLGGTGTVSADGTRYELENLSCLYIGRGTEKISFASAHPQAPAAFYLLSYPAHRTYPTKLVTKLQAETTDLGGPATCNKRRIHKYIHAGGIESCQLVMGFTALEAGSAWNTMPPHTHMRRSEVYLYFNLDEGDRVMHLMGPAQETRHIIVADRQAVISPGWSIHAGVGTSAYTFCWGMGGENQAFSDMDPVAITSLK